MRGKLPDCFGKLYDKLLHAFARASDCLHYRRAEVFFELRDVEFHSLSAGVVAHVERQNHGNVEFGKLCREVEASAGNRGVHNIEDKVDSGLCQLVEDHFLFGRARRQRIHAGEVDKLDFQVADFKRARLAFDRHAGVVADVLARARKVVENRSFAAVRIARKRNSETFFHL